MKYRRFNRQKNIDMYAAQPQGNSVEYCVLCGRPTNYTWGIPIDQRFGYISGCGQLCYSCCVSVEREAIG